MKKLFQTLYLIVYASLALFSCKESDLDAFGWFSLEDEVYYHFAYVDCTEEIYLSSESQTITINVKTRFKWRATTDGSDWITIKNDGYSFGDGSFVITISKNESAGPRKSSICITSDNDVPMDLCGEARDIYGDYYYSYYGWGDIFITQEAGQHISGTHRGHDYVDLGLPSGTKWATCNVGASSTEEYGDYFAWGETSPKSSYDWSNLKYCLDSTGETFSKYVTNSKYGTVDGKTELDLSDDAAHVNWGSGWRMPSRAQQDELLENCEWTWTTQGGHYGYIVVGPNGKSIFLPAAGYRSGSSSGNVGTYGHYWSRTLNSSNGWGAYYLFFVSDGAYTYTDYYDRRHGRSVRPVLGS